MKTTIDMAREAGATVEVGMAPVFNTHAELNRLVDLARADERRAIISRLLEIGALEDGAFIEAIRARGTQANSFLP
jgi:hypothetical protein